MQIVIDIPKKIYKNMQHRANEIQAEGYTLENAVLNGTPLPKRHGRLIDADAIKPKFCNSLIYNKYGEKGFWYYSVKDVNNAPTIIETDKEN